MYLELRPHLTVFVAVFSTRGELLCPVVLDSTVQLLPQPTGQARQHPIKERSDQPRVNGTRVSWSCKQHDFELLECSFPVDTSHPNSPHNTLPLFANASDKNGHVFSPQITTNNSPTSMAFSDGVHFLIFSGFFLFCFVCFFFVFFWRARLLSLYLLRVLDEVFTQSRLTCQERNNQAGRDDNGNCQRGVPLITQLVQGKGVPEKPVRAEKKRRRKNPQERCARRKMTSLILCYLSFHGTCNMFGLSG